jgi:hypothetical protein
LFLNNGFGRNGATTVAAGTGAAPQGLVYAQATTTSSYVTATGNTAISSSINIDFNNPTQQWDIGGCVTFRCVWAFRGPWCICRHAVCERQCAEKPVCLPEAVLLATFKQQLLITKSMLPPRSQ